LNSIKERRKKGGTSFRCSDLCEEKTKKRGGARKRKRGAKRGSSHYSSVGGGEKGNKCIHSYSFWQGAAERGGEKGRKKGRSRRGLQTHQPAQWGGERRKRVKFSSAGQGKVTALRKEEGEGEGKGGRRYHLT